MWHAVHHCCIIMSSCICTQIYRSTPPPHLLPHLCCIRMSSCICSWGGSCSFPLRSRVSHRACKGGIKEGGGGGWIEEKGGAQWNGGTKERKVMLISRMGNGVRGN